MLSAESHPISGRLLVLFHESADALSPQHAKEPFNPPSLVSWIDICFASALGIESRAGKASHVL